MEHYLKIFGRTHRLRAALLGLMLGFVSGQAAAEELCITTESTASAVDGVVAPGLSSGSCSADTLWPQIGPAAFQPAGLSPEVFLRLARITSGNRLRVGIDVAEDEDVSNFDAVLLFFDADNDDAWGDDDFAVSIAASPSNTAITSGEDCNETTGNVKYFQNNSGAWELNEAASAQITARYSYDYTSPDPESKVWNLEFEFPINSGGAFELTTTGDYFAVGGYVFADDGHQQSPQLGTVLNWPSAVLPTLTGVMPAISSAFSPLQATAPAANVLANINLESVCFDVNFSEHSWQINGLESDVGDNHINRTGNNRFRIGYYFDGPGDDPQLLSNPGTVRMDLMPFRSGGWQESQTWSTDIEVDETPYNYNQLHMVDEVVLNFPGEFDTTANIEEICADLYLEDFQVNDTVSNDNRHINHNYFVNSYYRQAVEVSAAGIPDLQPGQTSKIWMKLDHNNEHPDVSNFILAQHKQGGARAGSSASTCAMLGLPVLALAAVVLILLLVLLFARAAGWKKAGWIIWILLLLLLAWLLYQNCAGKGGQGHVGTPRFSITNADELGIKPLADKPGWYEMPIAHGETKRLQMLFAGQPLPYKPEHMRLEPVADGAPNRLDIPVTPGQVVTVIATGKVDIDGEGPVEPTMAGGFTEKTAAERDAQANMAGVKKLYRDRTPYVRRAQTALSAAVSVETRPEFTKQDYPLTEGHYQPHQFAGALAGWFHGAEANSGTFVIGRANSVLVPEGVDTLSVFVNARWESYGIMTGFYDLVVINTPAPTVPTRTVPGGDATYRLPLQLPPWHTLTAINMFTYFPVEVIQQNVPVSTTLLPLGDAHFTIYESHAETFDANAIEAAQIEIEAINR